MKFIITAVVGWAVGVVAIVLFTPAAVNTPGCAHRVGPLSADCQAAMAAGNDAVFWGQTVPFVVIVVAGTVAVASVAVALWRRSRSARDT